MQRFLSIAMALCLSLTLSLDANAARFGGGKSSGSAPAHQTRQAAPATPAAAPNAAGRPTPAASGASRWLGPLAGIAAGGLLAAMFMGDGFDGMQLFDFLLIGLIAFLIFRFIARRRAQQQAPNMAGAGAPYQRETLQPAQNPIFGSSATAAVSPAINAPAWFNEERFLEAARLHFLALQKHWDANEMDKIAEFVTPNMLQFLKKEHAEQGTGTQSTSIDNLHVQLDGVDDRADRTIATLTFSGVSRSSLLDKGETFSESWNMERAPGENQPWLVAGIRQNG